MIKYHPNLIQGSEEWHAARLGLLTASEMKLITTATFKVADNEKTRSHVYELAAQRTTGYVEPHYISDDMLRGKEDEILARAAYEEHYAPAKDVGFVTNDRWGFTIGYSPDGLIGEDGLIECKSRRQKFQFQTIADHVHDQTMPDDFLLQVQTGLLVTERKWLDFISYSGGQPMVTIRVFPDLSIQEAIVAAAAAFEAKVAMKMEQYRSAMASGARLIPTERRVEQEMSV